MFGLETSWVLDFTFLKLVAGPLSVDTKDVLWAGSPRCLQCCDEQPLRFWNWRLWGSHVGRSSWPLSECNVWTKRINVTIELIGKALIYFSLVWFEKGCSLTSSFKIRGPNRCLHGLCDWYDNHLWLRRSFDCTPSVWMPRRCQHQGPQLLIFFLVLLCLLCSILLCFGDMSQCNEIE